MFKVINAQLFKLTSLRLSANVSDELTNHFGPDPYSILLYPLSRQTNSLSRRLGQVFASSDMS